MPSANIQNLQSIEVRYDVHGNKLLKRENGLKRYAKDVTTTRTALVDKASYCVTGEKSKSEMDQEFRGRARTVLLFFFAKFLRPQRGLSPNFLVPGPLFQEKRKIYPYFLPGPGLSENVSYTGTTGTYSRYR